MSIRELDREVFTKWPWNELHRMDGLPKRYTSLDVLAKDGKYLLFARHTDLSTLSELSEADSAQDVADWLAMNMPLTTP